MITRFTGYLTVCFLFYYCHVVVRNNNNTFKIDWLTVFFEDIKNAYNL